MMVAASENRTSAPDVSTSSVTESSLASPSNYVYLTPGTSQTIPTGPVPAMSDGVFSCVLNVFTFSRNRMLMILQQKYYTLVQTQS